MNTDTPNSTTPRTDATFATRGESRLQYMNDGFVPIDFVPIDFARTLETELTTALAQVEALKKDKERLDWCESQARHNDNHLIMDWGSNLTIRQAIDAALATQPTPPTTK